MNVFTWVKSSGLGLLNFDGIVVFEQVSDAPLSAVQCSQAKNFRWVIYKPFVSSNFMQLLRYHLIVVNLKLS